MTKMTNVKALSYILTSCDLPEDVKAKVEAMKASYEKKASAEKKATSEKKAPAKKAEPKKETKPEVKPEPIIKPLDLDIVVN